VIVVNLHLILSLDHYNPVHIHWYTFMYSVN
jgi:hypothetical protein